MPLAQWRLLFLLSAVPSKRPNTKVVSWYASDDDCQAIRVRVAALGITRQEWLTSVIKAALLEQNETMPPVEIPDSETLAEAVRVLEETAKALQEYREHISTMFLVKALNGTLTLDDLTETAMALEVEPDDLKALLKLGRRRSR